MRQWAELSMAPSPTVNSTHRLGFPTLGTLLPCCQVLSGTNSPGNSLLASPESSK